MTAPKRLPRVQDVRPNLGSDPEFFFRDAQDNVIGAEKVLPKTGLKSGHGHRANIIIDGVQAELNPQPFSCRGSVASEIALMFRELEAELKKQGMQVVPDFSRAVEISKEKLMELSEESRRFGCAPSESIYDNPGMDISQVDPTEYRIRAAGGHIHIGSNGGGGLDRALKEDYTRTVQMLDIICGNTLVLVDRDPINAERRKVYGRAGEFRRPRHGLEYRTPSNFWLTSPPMLSLAMGLARLAVQLMADANRETFYKAFMSAVKLEDVQTAINTNDFDLAMKNFLAVAPLMAEVVVNATAPGYEGNQANSSYPIDPMTLPDFTWFANQVNEKGIRHFLPKDPMTYWTKDSDIIYGINDYLRMVIRPLREKWEKAEAERKAKEEAEAAAKAKPGLQIIYAEAKKKVTAKRGRAKKVA